MTWRVIHYTPNEGMLLLSCRAFGVRLTIAHADLFLSQLCTSVSVICRGYCGKLHVNRVISRDWNAKAREHRRHGTGDAPTQSPDPKPEAGAQANPLQREVHALDEVPESTNPLCQPWRAARPATTKTTPSNTCSSTILLDTRILAIIVWPRKEEKFRYSNQT